MFTWHQVPFTRLLIPLILGILFNVYFPFLFERLLWSIIVLPIIMLFFIKRPGPASKWLTGVPIYVLLFILGYQRSNVIQKRIILGEEMLITHNNSNFFGIVEKANKAKSFQRCEVSVKQILKDSSFQIESPVKAIVYFEDKDFSVAKDSIQPGDLIHFKAAFQTIQPPKNPGAFNYKQYLFYQGLTLQAFVNPKEWDNIKEYQHKSVFQELSTIRRQCFETLEKHIKAPENLAVASALILGEKSHLTSDLKSAYAASGAMHVLAVSGLHVGLIYLFVNSVLKLLLFFLPKRKFWITGLTILAIWSFVLITGASPSAKRAGLMFSLFALSQLVKRKNHSVNVLSSAAFILLILDPFELYKVGFQLSFSAVAGILAFQPIISRQFYFKNKIIKHFWDITAVGIAAQLATLPLSIMYFNQYSNMFWLSGLIVIDGAFIILLLGLILFFLQWLHLTLADCVGQVLDRFIGIINGLIFRIEAIPFSHQADLYLSELSTIVLLLTIFSAGLAIRLRNRPAIIVLMILLLSFNLNRANEKWLNWNKQELILYHDKHQFLLEGIKNQSITTIYSADIDDEKSIFGRKTYLLQNGLENFIISDTLLCNSKFFTKYQNLYDVGGKIIAIHDDGEDESCQKIPVDYLIVQGRSAENSKQLFATYQPDMLIIAANIPFQQSKLIKAACIANKVAYYDIRKEGAWRLKIR